MKTITPHIIDQLNSYATSCADKIAFRFLEDVDDVGTCISYASLQRNVAALARQLIHRRLQGKMAILVYEDAREFIISFLACLSAGIIAVPVFYATRSKQVARLLAIADDAAADTILCSADLVAGITESIGHRKMEIIPTIAEGGNCDQVTEMPAAYHSTAFVQYTSGSTARPRGVIISANNLMHNQRAIQHTFGCDEQSIIFCWLPFHHDMGLIGNLLHTIYTGCSCILMSPYQFMQQPRRWLSGISRYKATHSGGPNFAYDLCVEKIPPHEVSDLDLSTWRVAYNGSEPVSAATIKRFSDHFAAAGFKPGTFYPCYGLAEATLLVTGAKTGETPAVYEKQRTLVGSGAVATGMDVKIISSTGNEVQREGEEGEICIAGESVTSGYLNKNNDDYFIKLHNRLYLRTGDLGFFSRGELFVSGRIKEMLIVRGRNIYPYDIELLLAEKIPALEQNGVVIFNIEEGTDKLVVVAEIKRRLIAQIDAYAIIDTIERLVAGVTGSSPHDIILTPPRGIPRTTSGKLMRVQCKELYHQKAFSVIWSRLAADKTPSGSSGSEWLARVVMEKRDYVSIRNYLLAAIASRHGKLDPAIINDQTELADIGLDSLRSMELINLINKELHITLSIADILQNNHFSGIIHVIENLLWIKNKTPFGKEITI